MVVQVALSLVLLIGSGLLMKSFLRLQGTDVGFTASNLLLAEVRPPPRCSETTRSWRGSTGKLTDRLKGTPGVSDVAMAEQLPLLAGRIVERRLRGRPPGPGARGPRARPADGALVDGHFRALGIAVVQGREIEPSDTLGRPPVVVVNQALAERMWPGESAMGKVLVLPWSPEVRMEVVGIVANIREFGPASDPRPTFYPPLGQLPARSIQLGVRTAGDPMAVVSLVKQVASSVDRSVAVTAFQTMESRFARRTAAPRFRTVLLSIFGALSLVLAATGLYGLLSYLVAQRSHDLGVRLALGARPASLVWLVVRRGAWLAGLGFALGLCGGRAISGLMPSLLHQIEADDLPTIAAVSGRAGPGDAGGVRDSRVARGVCRPGQLAAERVARTRMPAGCAVRAGVTSTRPRGVGADDRLTFMGVPTPNLFDGSMNFHGKKEYVPLEWMDAAVETILHLMDVWVEKSRG